jgi:hypothetical protein
MEACKVCGMEKAVKNTSSKHGNQHQVASLPLLQNGYVGDHHGLWQTRAASTVLQGRRKKECLLNVGKGSFVPDGKISAVKCPSAAKKEWLKKAVSYHPIATHKLQNDNSIIKQYHPNN